MGWQLQQSFFFPTLRQTVREMVAHNLSATLCHLSTFYPYTTLQTLTHTSTLWCVIVYKYVHKSYASVRTGYVDNDTDVPGGWCCE